MAHVASAVVGFGSLVFTGVFASRAGRGPSAPGAQAVRRYFRPGVNWPGRVLYLVPVFGFALLAASGGVFDSSDSFVVIGLAMWFAATALAEVVVWPSERRIQSVVADKGDWSAAATESFVRDCRRVVLSTTSLGVVFVAAVVVMVAKP